MATVTSVTWNGNPSLAVIHNGGGSVTFTLTGSATVHYDDSSTEEAAYEIFSGNTSVVSLDASVKTRTARIGPGTKTFTCKAYKNLGGVVTYSSSGNPTNTFTVPGPDLTWSSGAKLTATISGSDLVLSISGDVSVHNGYSSSGLLYYFYYGQNSLGSYINKSIIWTNGAQYTQYDYSAKAAIAVYDEIEGWITVYSPALITSLNNLISYYNGSQWIQCIAYYFNGSTWDECKPYYFNGTSWVEISS